MDYYILKKLPFPSICLLVLLFISSCDYVDLIKNKLQNSFSADYSRYHFLGTPVGNYGIGTIYYTEGKNINPDELQDYAINLDTIFVNGLSPDEISNLKSKIIMVGIIGNFSETDSISMNSCIEAALPNINNVLNANLSVNATNGVNVSLNADCAADRRLNWGALFEAMHDNKIKPEYCNSIRQKKVNIINDDLILNGFNIQINIDTGINPSLNVAISNFVATDQTVEIGGLKLSARMDHDGQYSFHSIGPVVVAIKSVPPPKDIFSGN